MNLESSTNFNNSVLFGHMFFTLLTAVFLAQEIRNPVTVCLKMLYQTRIKIDQRVVMQLFTTSVHRTLFGIPVRIHTIQRVHLIHMIKYSLMCGKLANLILYLIITVNHRTIHVVLFVNHHIIIRIFNLKSFPS